LWWILHQSGGFLDRGFFWFKFFDPSANHVHSLEQHLGQFFLSTRRPTKQNSLV
jgi:hypothetical protein